MTNMNWQQAFAEATAQPGRKVRRTGWQHWLFYDASTFVWMMDYSEAPTADVCPEGWPVKHVVLNSEFGAQEFLASDWTDEDWNISTGSCPAGQTWDTQSQSCLIAGSFATVTTTAAATATVGTTSTTENGITTTTTTTAGTSELAGTTTVSKSVSPTPSQPSGGGGGTGGGGGGTPPAPPTPPITQGNDYTPTVSLNLNAPAADGPSCYINQLSLGEPATCEPTVEVTTAAATNVSAFQLHCQLGGQIQLATVGPGSTYTFSFPNTTIVPGGSLTAVVIATANGNINQGAQSWTGADSQKFAKMCPPGYFQSISLYVSTAGVGPIGFNYDAEVLVSVSGYWVGVPSPLSFPVDITLTDSHGRMQTQTAFLSSPGATPGYSGTYAAFNMFNYDVSYTANALLTTNGLTATGSASVGASSPPGAPYL